MTSLDDALAVGRLLQQLDDTLEAQQREYRIVYLSMAQMLVIDALAVISAMASLIWEAR